MIPRSFHHPPSATTTAVSQGLPVTPFTVAPALRNPEQVRRALERECAAMLEDSGIAGPTVLCVHISGWGDVLEVRVGVGSGHHLLDEAALRLLGIMRFGPALDRDRTVPVRIELPIMFTTR